MTVDGLLVIGSGPAGVSAAEAYREHGGAGPVRIVSADIDPPYNRPPLSKDFLRGEVDAASTALHDDGFYAERDIELLLGRRVAELLVAERAATLDDGRRLPYAACVLATGSVPIRPPIPGADEPRAMVLRSLRDADALRKAAETADRVVVAGSGFIGCEAAASLAARGLDVTLLTSEQRPHQARLGDWAAERIALWLRAAGVTLITGERVAQLSAAEVRTDTGRSLGADLVLFATGVRPQAQLAVAAGLAIERGRVRVDASMRTTGDRVFAAGDVAHADNASAGRAISVEHWGDAMTMGEIAGRNAAGDDGRWSEPPGFWSTIGDRTLKYCAWSDGFDDVRVDADPNGAFTVWHGKDGVVVGVLTVDHDEDYERGQQLVQAGAPW
ncbi:NAD(P)/FAD-dependent oxidoreductase [uncultured Jatrophihabitans sp.]|uniref:NAD(P)/FAD-dependent oxidoreductase n=1 Tax=uncultured Jatrophihabitans sp. TaxID=1610747 RepID=UPI0035CACB2E